jgi:hypothetical protein
MNNMRSSKSRSRNKSNNNNNRNRSGVNVVNRVFDSSGPEGKVRGTPQQIIEKYVQLARDAQLSNDRVAAENFQQHSEHYIRLLSDAQREIDAKRELQEKENRERQQARNEQQQHQPQQQSRPQPQSGAPVEQPNSQPEVAVDPSQSAQPDIIEPAGESPSGLVDTPEEKKRPRRARKPKPKVEEASAPETPETAETPE